jgi:hypothetical protein
MGKSKVIYMFDIKYNEIEESGNIGGTSTVSIGNSVQTPELQEEFDDFSIIIQPGIGSMPDLPSNVFKITAGIENKEKTISINEDSIIEASKKYYLKNKKEIEKNYIGKFIAIIDARIVDVDKDFSELSKKVYKRYGYKTIFMTYVSEKDQIVKAPSPRVLKI